jgi:type IV pilus assembly protein PilM
MPRWLPTRRFGPIGIDVGLRSVKLLQLDSQAGRVLDAARCDLPPDGADDKDAPQRDRHLIELLRQAREGRRFRGRDAVLCLDWSDLLVQNIRVAKTVPVKTPAKTPPGRLELPELDRLVQQEAARRVPFSIAEAEIRYLEAADVRQGDSVMREVVLLACHRPALERKIDLIRRAGFRPAAVDVEPLALLRCYIRQSRREEDRRRRGMFVHVGYTNSLVVIAQGPDVLFVKYVDVGGRHLDEAVARHLKMSLTDAVALRRNNGDRRAEQQDPEIARSIGESVRPVVDRLAHELSLCVRYHSVTFRGQPLVQLVLGGGEATPSLVEAIGSRLDLKCELGDPLRLIDNPLETARKGQWDVAAGLALRGAI